MNTIISQLHGIFNSEYLWNETRYTQSGETALEATQGPLQRPEIKKKIGPQTA